jgi:hypothetical protein
MNIIQKAACQFSYYITVSIGAGELLWNVASILISLFYEIKVEIYTKYHKICETEVKISVLLLLPPPIFQKES